MARRLTSHSCSTAAVLFLGSESFPRENEYNEFLSEHGGFSNAWTSDSYTCFYFDVIHGHFRGALDRFAPFFTEPLFSATCTEREINAVDSENTKNLQNDGWRFCQVDRETSLPEHPYNRFTVGNKTTLSEIPASKGIDIREAVMQFHKDHYSANIMTVVLLGRLVNNHLLGRSCTLDARALLAAQRLVLPLPPPSPAPTCSLTAGQPPLRIVPRPGSRWMTLSRW